MKHKELKGAQITPLTESNGKRNTVFGKRISMTLSRTECERVILVNPL